MLPLSSARAWRNVILDLFEGQSPLTFPKIALTGGEVDVEVEGIEDRDTGLGLVGAQFVSSPG